MTQHAMTIANQSGGPFRADINNAIAALVSNSSGASTPAVTFPFQFWADTTSGYLKQRNSANSGWISLFLMSSGDLAQRGGITMSGEINEKRSSVAAAATTTPLWNAGNGNIQDWSNTPTITDFPAAPQAGATRVVYPAVGTVFTHAGNISVQGNANYTVASGDEITIRAVTTTTFTIGIRKKDGTAVVTGSPAAAIQNQTYTAFTTGGTGSAYTFTPSPALTTYTNARFFAILSADPSGSPTFNISTLGAKNFKYKDSAGNKQFVTTTQAKNGHLADIAYDGTDLVLLNPLPSTGGYTSFTPVATTSGTAFDFTVPSGTKHIRIELTAVSFTAGVAPSFRIGTGGVPDTTGYDSSDMRWNASANNGVQGSTTGFILTAGGTAGAADTYSGVLDLTLIDSSTNTWLASFIGRSTDSQSFVRLMSGTKSLSGALDIVRIYGGTFDAGKAGGMYI